MHCTYGSTSEYPLLLFNSVEGSTLSAIQTDKCVTVIVAILTILL